MDSGPRDRCIEQREMMYNLDGDYQPGWNTTSHSYRGHHTMPTGSILIIPAAVIAYLLITKKRKPKPVGASVARVVEYTEDEMVDKLSTMAQDVDGIQRKYGMRTRADYDAAVLANRAAKQGDRQRQRQAAVEQKKQGFATDKEVKSELRGLGFKPADIGKVISFVSAGSAQSRMAQALSLLVSLAE